MCQYTLDFDSNTDMFYELVMPKLGIDMAIELRQIGQSNGFELYRIPNRKIDPPRSDHAFHMRTQTQALCQQLCSNESAMTARFMNFYDTKSKVPCSKC